MLRKLVISLLSLAAIAFITPTRQRLTLPYNGNGVYFNGEVTHSTALLIYGVLAVAFFVAAVALGLFWKKLGGRDVDL